MPRMDISGAARRGARRACASSSASSTDDGVAGLFARADLVVLPYREIDQSGVLFTALAFGKPLLVSDVGGFPELAATGRRAHVPGRRRRGAARARCAELLADRAGAGERMGQSAVAAAAAARTRGRPSRGSTLALYETLLG